jgi:uncharacterized protein (DUF342 family)
MEQMAIETPDALKLIGQLAVRFHMITEAQLQQALAQQQAAERKTAVGQTLVEMGLISTSQLSFLLSAQEMKALRTKDIKFGRIAVENHFVTEQQVEEALKQQKTQFIKQKKKTLLGDILVATGIITEEQKQHVIEVQQRIIKAREEKAAEAAVITEEPLLSAEEGVELTLSKDGMKATLRASAAVDDEEIRGRITELLTQYEIVFGLQSDSVIEEWIKRGAEREERFVIAEGKAPVPGHGGKLTYHFDTDPLKAGKIKEGDVIDFKDRGEIPQVDEGALLAELSAPDPGIAGTDVQGKEIAPPAVKSNKLLCGNGAKLSEDGRNISAEVNGSPSLSRTGAVSVFPLYKIEENVGYKTGHIDFDGDIQVGGTIEKDFKVTGGKLTAKEVEDAEIVMKGDVVISGGILGGRIKCGGNVMAAYIHNAQLEVDGDVLVQKEIMGCDIKSGGGFYSKTAIVLDSNITAKEGIITKDIGSDVSGPSTLTVGSDALLELRISELNDHINQQRKQQTGLRKKIEEAEAENQQINVDIAEVAQVQDLSQVEQRELTAKRDVLIQQGEQQQADAISQKIVEDEAKAKEAEQKLNDMFDRQDQIANETQQCEHEITTIEDGVSFTSQELEALEQQMTEEQADVSIQINGTLYPMTTITTTHTSVKTKQAMQALLIRERAKRTEAGDEVWKIVTESLK